MGTCTINHHNHMTIRMSLPNLLEKHAHAFSVHLFGGHPVQSSILGAYGRIKVAKFANQGQIDCWTYGHWRPASGRIAHAPESGLILKQQQKWRLVSCYLFGDDVGKFFLNSSRTASSPLGCRVSGVTLRQPCRASSLCTVDFGTLWPTRSSSAKWMGGITSTPPVSACATQGSRNDYSSSMLISARCRPPRRSPSVIWEDFARSPNCRRRTQTLSRLKPNISAVMSIVAPARASNKMDCPCRSSWRVVAVETIWSATFISSSSCRAGLAMSSPPV